MNTDVFLEFFTIEYKTRFAIICPPVSKICLEGYFCISGIWGGGGLLMDNNFFLKNGME